MGPSSWLRVCRDGEGRAEAGEWGPGPGCWCVGDAAPGVFNGRTQWLRLTQDGRDLSTRLGLAGFSCIPEGPRSAHQADPH